MTAHQSYLINLIDNINMAIISHFCDNSGKMVILNIKMENDKPTIVSIYASCKMKFIFDKNVYPNNLIILGDFNIIHQIDLLITLRVEQKLKENIQISKLEDT